MFGRYGLGMLGNSNLGYAQQSPYSLNSSVTNWGGQPSQFGQYNSGYNPFGDLGFQPMGQRGLAGLGILNPNVMSFNTPRFDQPIQPFGMHTLDPFGYQNQFPAGNVATPQQPRDNGMAALLSQLPKAESWGEQIALQRMGDNPSAPAMMQFMQDYGIDPYTNKRVPGYNRMKWNVPEGHYDGG